MCKDVKQQYKSIAFPIIKIPYQSGTFIIIDEPTLTCNDSKFAVYFVVYFWCYTVYGFQQMYNDMYPFLQYYTQ